MADRRYGGESSSSGRRRFEGNPPQGRGGFQRPRDQDFCARPPQRDAAEERLRQYAAEEQRRYAVEERLRQDAADERRQKMTQIRLGNVRAIERANGLLHTAMAMSNNKGIDDTRQVIRTLMELSTEIQDIEVERDFRDMSDKHVEHLRKIYEEHLGSMNRHLDAIDDMLDEGRNHIPERQDELRRWEPEPPLSNHDPRHWMRSEWQ